MFVIIGIFAATGSFCTFFTEYMKLLGGKELTPLFIRLDYLLPVENVIVSGRCGCVFGDRHGLRS